MMNSKNKNSLAVISFILGMVSLIFSLLIFGAFIAIIIGIITIIIAKKALRQNLESRFLAITGLVLGIIAVIISGIVIISIGTLLLMY